MDYKIIYSDRKTLCLCVQKDGTVTVKAPFLTNKSQIDMFVAKHIKWIENRRAQIIKKENLLQNIREDELKQKALQYIPFRAEHYANIMGVEFSDIKITGAKTRFGSCSAKNSLCFSLYLMAYPKDAIDYVIVHELAHIKQKNHSPAFYDVIESVMPEYKAYRKLLKDGVL